MLEPTVRLPSPRRSDRRLGGWARRLWTSPTNLVGRLAALAVGQGPGATVGGPAAQARLYRIRGGIGLDWVGAVTLGHVVLYRPGLFDGRLGRLVLAHELAHTRQHDWLGPLYLPLHILAQAVSAVLSLGRPVLHSRVHDRNPLEQTFICLGASACAPLADGARVAGAAGAPVGVDAEAMLTAFGLLSPTRPASPLTDVGGSPA